MTKVLPKGRIAEAQALNRPRSPHHRLADLVELRWPAGTRPEDEGLEPSTRAFQLGGCTIFLSHTVVHGWHLSISHPRREPRYDEVAHARYALIPPDVTMAYIIPPESEYVNVHPFCMQIWEVVSTPAGLTRLGEPQ